MSRRHFLRTAAGGTAVVLGSGLVAPALAGAAPAVDPRPRPIPGGIEFGGKFFHVFIPGFRAENSTITDFNGFVGAALIAGTGTGTDTTTNETSKLIFDVDMRFMQGVYVGMDGRRRRGTFGFI